RGIVPRFGFHLLDEQLLGLVGRQPRDALELPLLRDDELLVLRRGRSRLFLLVGDGAVAGGELFLQPLDRALPLGELRFARRERLLGRRGPLALVARLALG